MKYNILLYLFFIVKTIHCADKPAGELDQKPFSNGKDVECSYQDESARDDDSESTLSYQEDISLSEHFNITLDISSAEDSIVTRFEQEYGGASHRIFFPRRNVHIESVKEDGIEIWKSKESEECIFAECYQSGDITILYIDIKKDDSSYLVHFEKKDDTWSEIEIETFYGILESIMSYPENNGEEVEGNDNVFPE
ncbi:signal peptide-containing protein [Theileria equi strain WA]|uniref:Signal peptide-containing protein n=1 Tax=Theileria equi strain WA TaxID=1537102 RepID=L0AZL1_THEEQ|nr:signal peptide-containing protein [Theileria equi strain WA]AFZ81032.1 signal peptide-containing protein [Theileria equi strain WA]|eukprot:XP_004830698.1 signal peptide-containing protein [Theileria equi strain WA]